MLIISDNIAYEKRLVFAKPRTTSVYLVGIAVAADTAETVEFVVVAVNNFVLERVVQETAELDLAVVADTVTENEVVFVDEMMAT